MKTNFDSIYRFCSYETMRNLWNINKFVILYYQQFQIRASHRLINLRDKVALFFLLKPNFGSQVAYTVYN